MGFSAYDAMKRQFLQGIESVPLELLSVSAEKQKKKDGGNEDQGFDEFVRVSVEVPRGYGVLSRVQFDVKIPGGMVKVTEQELEAKVYEVVFDGLTISFINSSKNTVYLRADDYQVAEVGE